MRLEWVGMFLRVSTLLCDGPQGKEFVDNSCIMRMIQNQKLINTLILPLNPHCNFLVFHMVPRPSLRQASTWMIIGYLFY